MIQEVPELERAKRLIRKLAERTADRGCTEAEAMESAEKVGALLKQFDLTLDEVLIGQEICRKAELFADDDTAFGVISGIARLCSLRHYHVSGSTPPTYVIFGFERDVELGLYLYEVIMEALQTEWGEHVRVHGYARKARDSFRMGFGSRVHSRLVQMRRQRDDEAAQRAVASSSKDLVLVRDARVDEEFAKTGVRLVAGRSRRVRDYSAYSRGDAAGQRVNIHTPVNGDAKSLLR